MAARLRQSLVPLALVVLCAGRAYAQEEKPVFRADLAMVQVDVVVTDQKGQLVAGLDCEDFEIFEDDRRQPVAQCAFVPLQGPALESLPAAPSAVPPTTVGPPARIDKSAVQRVMVLVVDDLNLDLQSVEAIRTGLKSFVADEMQPGDLVSLVRTGSGRGALQQFTSDKRILMAAIDRVRFNIRSEVDAFEPVHAVPVLTRNPQGMAKIEQLRVEVLSAGTIAAFRLVLRGLEDLPGRKSVVFFSKGWALRDRDGLTAFGRAIPDLVDLANRASAVIYAVDVLGVFTGQLTAGDDMNDPNINNRLLGEPRYPEGSLMNLTVRPRAAPRPGLDGLSALSDPTGGLLLQGGNDLSQQLKRIVDDQRGYYLVGYVPRPSAFERVKGSPAFHKITVKVRRKGLTVRSRSGFHGAPDAAIGTMSGHAPTLGSAVLSPFQANGIRLKLSSVFTHDKTKGDSVQALLRVDASDVTFEQGEDGLLKSRLALLIATFDVDGQVVDQINQLAQLDRTPEEHARDLRRGMSYRAAVSVKRPGAYQLRVAVKDALTGHMGSAYEFVEVPDVAGRRLSLSGILMIDGGSAPHAAASDRTGAVSESGAFSGLTRVFSSDRSIAYGLTIYNAHVGRDGAAQLTTQARLFHEGREVIAFPPASVDSRGQPDPKALFAGGTLVLPRQWEPGDYVLQVSVTDKLAAAGRQTTSQVTEFELESY